MKKNILLLLVTFSFGLDVLAQEIPQWEFWLAFEDATGAKDTVWIAMDEEGTFDNDMQFGEFPQNMNEDEFHVYFIIEGGKSDRRVFPITSTSGGIVYAWHYEYPITLSWDTTLFSAPILMNSVEGPINNPLLDNDYFFNYHLGFPSYHMLFEESVEMPEFFWGSMDHFPVYFYFFRGFGDPLNTSEKMKEQLSIHPNPATDQIQVSGMEGIERISVFTLSGKLVMQEVFFENRPINVSHLKEGAYIVQVETEKGVAISKFVKANN
jgi:hypothetical protein